MDTQFIQGVQCLLNCYILPTLRALHESECPDCITINKKAIGFVKSVVYWSKPITFASMLE